MLPEILIRLLISVVAIVAALALYRLCNWFLLHRAASKVGSLAGLRSGSPAILYFTTPTCVPCKTIQRPAIHALKEQLGEAFQLIEVDTSIHPELADEWGVRSVPTTFLIDASGRPRQVNNGVASKEKLFQQLREII